MRILRRTQSSFCLVLTAGFLLSSIYILVVRNPRDVKGTKADRLNTIHVAAGMDQAVGMTGRKYASPSSGTTSYLTTNEIDKHGKASAGTEEHTTENGLNARLQTTLPTIEVIDRETKVLKSQEAATHTEVAHDRKPVQTPTWTSQNFNEAGMTEAQVNNKETDEELANVPVYGQKLSTVYLENVIEKSLSNRSAEMTRNSSQKGEVASGDEAHRHSREQPLCKYPDLQMESSEFNYLFENITNLYCGHAPISHLTYLDGNSRTDEYPWDLVKLNSSALLPTQTLLNCTYSRIKRFGDYEILYTTLHSKVFVSNQETIQFPFKDEFAKVNCFLEEDVFNQTERTWVKVIRKHNNMFVQVMRNDDLVKDKKADMEKDGRMKTALGQGMNVLMVGVDSTSRMNIMRKLPKTFKYFTDTLEGHVMKGYHVIGDGTTAQFFGMLTGFLEEELPSAKRGMENSTTCDAFPFVWNKFRRMGYTTMHGEDEAWSGTFQFRTRGFEKQPTDYYMRPFWVAQEDLPESEEWFCFGATPKHHYTLKYARDFVEAYHDIPKFAIAFHTELSHDSLNMVQVADDDILTLIKSWKDKGYLNNTVFILFADHGARYGDLKKLLQGRLEERLPFFGIAVPPWMKVSHPEIIRNLRKNEERLTSAFDFHKMLQHVMDYPGDPFGFQGHGISLFQEIPINRTCEDASIADHWCTCLQTVPINKTNKLVREAAGFAVSYMNHLTSVHRSLCVELFLRNITHAEIIKPNHKLLQFGGSDPLLRKALFGKDLDVPFLDFRITLETGPNGGAYEVSVRKWLSDKKTEITADISRINVYGDHPRCIQDNFPRLRKYCFCREFLKPVPQE
ncbi:uncharacterized protein [Branchiostoma lanceolatum]|uniref:uncharacterized protein n=1 Tax=Branchiostoma lanceolatum TaxID=7740 RepID=UPI003454A033